MHACMHASITRKGTTALEKIYAQKSNLLVHSCVSKLVALLCAQFVEKENNGLREQLEGLEADLSAKRDMLGKAKVCWACGMSLASALFFMFTKHARLVNNSFPYGLSSNKERKLSTCLA